MKRSRRYEKDVAHRLQLVTERERPSRTVFVRVLDCQTSRLVSDYVRCNENVRAYYLSSYVRKAYEE